MSWLSWYKKDSGISIGITEHTMRNYLLNPYPLDVKR
jgi:hypothetical protein